MPSGYIRYMTTKSGGGCVAGPLEGISAIDLGFWVAGPSVAGLLADWGADVIKIEPPTGDPLRGGI